jgi:hypothetical protein
MRRSVTIRAGPTIRKTTNKSSKSKSTTIDDADDSKTRAPPRRNVLPGERSLWDGKHPGPVSFQLHPTHRAKEFPFQFEHRPEDKLVEEHKRAHPLELLLFFRAHRAKTTAAAGGGGKATKSMSVIEHPTPGTILTIINLATKTEAKVIVRTWFQQAGYRSGHCTVESVS